MGGQGINGRLGGLCSTGKVKERKKWLLSGIYGKDRVHSLGMEPNSMEK